MFFNTGLVEIWSCPQIGPQENGSVWHGLSQGVADAWPQNTKLVPIKVYGFLHCTGAGWGMRKGPPANSTCERLGHLLRSCNPAEGEKGAKILLKLFAVAPPALSSCSSASRFIVNTGVTWTTCVR